MRCPGLGLRKNFRNGSPASGVEMWQSNQANTEFHRVHTKFHGVDSNRHFAPKFDTFAEAPCAKRY
jgi:hypothetical protein